MEQVSFVLHIDPSHVEEYKKRHQQVYPELEAEFARVGIHRYHIFFHEGVLFAYMEVDDYKSAMEQLSSHPANTKWQQYMSDLLLDWDEGVKQKDLEEVYRFVAP